LDRPQPTKFAKIRVVISADFAGLIRNLSSGIPQILDPLII
jgi:hypothetical protein